MAVSAPTSPGRSTAFMPSPNVKPKLRISRATTTSAADDVTDQEDGEGFTGTGFNFDTRSETSSSTSIDTLANLIKWVPGSNQELFDAEDKLLAYVKVPHELVHVSIGSAPNVKERIASESAGKEAQKAGGYMSLVPSFTHILPRFSVLGATKAIAQGVGLPGWSTDANQNCYINTLLVGDVAQNFAELHRPSSVGDLASLVCMEPSEGKCSGVGESPSSADQPRDVRENQGGAAASPESAKQASGDSPKVTMTQRLLASILPFSSKSHHKAAAPRPSSEDPKAGLDREPTPRAVARQQTAAHIGIQAAADAGATETRNDVKAGLFEAHQESDRGSAEDDDPSSPGSDAFYEAETPSWAREQQEKKNLVMVHGYAACIGFFFRNFETLSQHFNIYAIDQLGWGASSRPSFTPETAEEAETWFVEALELWRQEVGLQKFVLLGHSFGGFISSKYALKYSQHVEHLILVGPAGFNHVSPKMHRFRQTWKGYLLGMVWETNLTPQLMLKFLGPWSEDFVKRSVVQRWSKLPPGQEDMQPEEVQAFAEYIFQSLLAPMSGELCMKHVFSLGAFARRPLIDRAKDWKAPTTFIYGNDDIMDYRAGLGAAKLIPVPAEVLLVQEAGHMLFLERPTLFNHAVLHACRDLLPADSLEVQEASRAVALSVVPLSQCHGIPDEDSDALFCAQGPGRGMVRLSSGWGIG